MADYITEERNVFAVNLKKYMSEHKKTQTMLAEDLGVSKSTVSAWCRGKKLPNTDFIKTIAIYFGVNKKDLFEDKNSPKDVKASGQSCTVTDEMLKQALFGESGGITDEQLEEVKSFARFILFNSKEKGIYYYGML